MKYELKGRGKITCNKEMMNLLSLLAENASEMYRLKGYNSLAEEAEEISKTMYNMLDEVGFYDNVR